MDVAGRSPPDPARGVFATAVWAAFASVNHQFTKTGGSFGEHAYSAGPYPLFVC